MRSGLQSATKSGTSSVAFASLRSDATDRFVNRAIVISYTLLLMTTIVADQGALRLTIYLMPLLIIGLRLFSTSGEVLIDLVVLRALGVLCMMFFVAAAVNSYAEYSSRQYIFTVLAPASFLIAIRFDRTFMKELAVGLLCAQLLFLALRLIDGRLHFDFDIFNYNAHLRVASESFVAFPLSAVALYFGMTRQRWWMLVCLAGVLLGLRRGPMAAALVGLVVFLVTNRLPIGKVGIVLTCAALFAVGAVISVNATAVLSALAPLLGPELSVNQFTNGRYEMYQILAQPITESNWSFWLGHGPGYNVDFLFGLGLGRQPWDHPHNDFLTILLDFGVAGLAMFVSAWLILIGRNKFAIALVAYMVVLWLVDNTAVYFFHLVVFLFVVWRLRLEAAEQSERGISI